MTNKTFIAYTCGFMVSHDAYTRNLLVKAEFNQTKDGQIEITAASGNNLGRIAKFGSALVSREEFENRPQDNVEEARWALGKLGASF